MNSKEKSSIVREYTNVAGLEMFDIDMGDSNPQGPIYAQYKHSTSTEALVIINLCKYIVSLEDK